jgi:hypothetical protein
MTGFACINSVTARNIILRDRGLYRLSSLPSHSGVAGTFERSPKVNQTETRSVIHTTKWGPDTGCMSMLRSVNDP